ncbi:MAG: OmpA family protein [Hyphomicrobium sp.]
MQKFIAVLLSSVSLAGVAAQAESASGDVPAWAAEAKMNPDYQAPIPAGGAEAPAAADTVPTADAPPADTPAADDAKAAEEAEAKRKAEEEAAAATKAAEEAEANRKAEEEAAAAAKAAEEAEAKRKEEEAAAAAAKAAEDAAAAAKSAEEAKRQQLVEACRDSLNAEALIGKLTFGSSKWDVQPKSYGALDKIAQVAKDCGDVVIEIGGHTDNQGKSESNITISQLRAQSILKYLTKAGVDATKLRAVGYGDTKPAVANDSAENRRKNRRVEFLVTHKDSQS